MSCNGCRVLRKACSDSCPLRPCLQWIDGADAQTRATKFVAKFFGRQTLHEFISAVPDNQRPALFRSLLYEACGRKVNPVYGAVGLLWSGNWNICQAAVDAVLRFGSLEPVSATSLENLPCYGPMPNLPKLHPKASIRNQRQQQQKQEDDEDVKSVNHQQAFASPSPHPEDTKPQVLNNINNNNNNNNNNSSSMRGVLQPLDQRQNRMAAMKRERDEESPEIIAPVARRPRVFHVAPIAGVGEPAIDLELTLSSHPPTPQLCLPARGKNAGGSGNGNNSNNSNCARPSNSFSSEGSVTSLDTADFIASRSVSLGMDLLHRMEEKRSSSLTAKLQCSN